MTLARLDATDLCVLDIRPDHNPTVLAAQTQLQAIWDGEYDKQDTVTALRNVADKLNTLATAINTQRFRHHILTTTNESLQDAIATLKSIHDGEYDANDAEKQLRKLTHNLNCLRNLLIHSMYKPPPHPSTATHANTAAPELQPLCPRCHTERIGQVCTTCDYRFNDGPNG